ncbi:MAG: 50S ribosomal protein L19 [Thermotogae bacterium]|nr:50S ribosomal protein L19 [Thermotogota bacterium]
MDEIIRKVEADYRRQDLPQIKPGDTVRVHWRITEFKEDPKTKSVDVRTRVQVFEGVVIALQGKGLNRRIVVRKISHGVPVERIFPIHSPYLEKLEIVNRAKVRRAKLYYLRHKVGRAARLKIIRENQGKR